MATNSASNKATTLFALMKTIPRELRDQIYTKCLRQTSDVLITDCEIPPLLLVCKQVRHEALPIFYSVNTFRYIMIAAAAHEQPFIWLKSLSPVARAAIKILGIHLHTAVEAKLRLTAFLERRLYECFTDAPNITLDSFTNLLDTELQEQKNVARMLHLSMQSLHRGGIFELSKLHYRAVVTGSELDPYDQDIAITLTWYRDALLNNA
ncbi:hypothetical protein LTR86_003782 [Recurvomyces mirabilis]|nr:hypothetical protein LTR86_003782 [Recurvomyces mirabilis]